MKKIRRLDPEKIVSAACVFLRDERGRLLMVKTRYADAVKWSLPGGGHHHGESLADTARREMREETGVAVRLIRHMGVIERIEPAWSLHLTLHMFQAEPIAAEDWRRESFAPEAGDGVEEVAWFDRDRLRAEPETVLGRRLWLELADRPDEWPPHILMQPGEE
ncbi:MAG: NUDIX hydrolase [Planctomycetes bacterium]|nr:NUDIX hydrolase [Planctomycetota bacterium]